MYFVTAAQIAAELDKAIKVAKEISLASNNARVLAVRAGADAAGFGALAEFLDQLAKKTIQASNSINIQAISISKITSNAMRTHSAKVKFDSAYVKASDSENLSSLDKSYSDIQQRIVSEQEQIRRSTIKLTRSLEELKQELEVGKVLASMSLVEASQAGNDYTSALTDNAKNIASALERIEVHVKKALSLLNKSGDKK